MTYEVQLGQNQHRQIQQSKNSKIQYETLICNIL